MFTLLCMQNLPHYVEQGRQFACGLGKTVHIEAEVFDLAEMYGGSQEAHTVAELAKRVCCRFCMRATPVTSALPSEVFVLYNAPFDDDTTFVNADTKQNCLQPVLDETYLCDAGKACLSEVRSWADRYGKTVTVEASGIAEECEREIEACKEAEKEVEKTADVAAAVPRTEVDWRWADALTSQSVRNMGASGPQARHEVFTVQLLLSCWRRCIWRQTHIRQSYCIDGLCF